MKQELQALVDNWVKEEIFYREGIAMGLDRDDPVVRRRIDRNSEFILEGATPPAPTDAELQAWLDAHPRDYQIEPTYSLRQVYFDPARHGDRLDAHIAAAQRALASGRAFTGDTTMLPPTMEEATAMEVARVFGNEFGERVKAMLLIGWLGTGARAVEVFGLHLVERDRQEGRLMVMLSQTSGAT